MRLQIFGALALIAGLAAGPAAADVVRFRLTDGVHDATWFLPQDPTPDVFVDEESFDIDGPVPGVEDGEPIEFLFFAFYAASEGGAFSTQFAGDFGLFVRLDLYGEQLFTGPVDAPTFRLGTFALTEGCETCDDRYDLTISAGVPEPATWALMISGFGAAGVALRGRRRVIA